MTWDQASWKTDEKWRKELQKSQAKGKVDKDEETQKAYAATASENKKIQEGRPRYKDYQKLMRTFKPGKI